MIKNTTLSYGYVAIVFHWIMAVMIVVLFALGIYMHELPFNHPSKFMLYQMHKSFGMFVLLLAIFRLCWRFLNPVPRLPDDMPRVLRIMSSLGHGGLYALMMAIPLTGWMIVSASNLPIPTVLFGVIPLPHLPISGLFEQPGQAEELFEDLHGSLAFFIMLLALLHVAAALRHHFILKDTVLRRMIAPLKTPDQSEPGT